MHAHIYNKSILSIYQRCRIYDSYVKEEHNRRSSIGKRPRTAREQYSSGTKQTEKSMFPRMNVVITLISIFLPQFLVIWVHSDIQSLARFLIRRALKFTQTVSYIREISPRNWTTAQECERRISMTFRGSFTEHFVWRCIHIEESPQVSLRKRLKIVSRVTRCQNS